MDTAGSLEEATDRTVRTVMLAGVVPAVLLGLLALLVHPLLGLVVALAVGLGWAAVVWQRTAGAAARVLDPLGATHLAAGSEPRLENLLEGVCIVGGIEEPTVLVVPDPTLNALAVADAGGATFVVSRGLLDGLGRVELEGVLANLAARVKSGAARYTTTVLALPVPRSYAHGLLQRGLGEQSSVRCDLAAVGLTKYPPGLISALAVMAERGTTVAAADRSAGALWLADPGAGSAAGEPADDEHGVAPQPLPLRIAVLQEL